jgi:hypothetical protein
MVVDPMQIPITILRGLYTRGSLRRVENKIEFEIKIASLMCTLKPSIISKLMTKSSHPKMYN